MVVSIAYLQHYSFLINKLMNENNLYSNRGIRKLLLQNSISIDNVQVRVILKYARHNFIIKNFKLHNNIIYWKK